MRVSVACTIRRAKKSATRSAKLTWTRLVSSWPRIAPAIYYLDAAKAIDWLCRAFGFKVRLKVEGEGGRIEHSELVYGEGLVMVGEAERQEKAPYRSSPRAAGGINTQNLMVYVDDAEAH